jgi:tripartite-type tricarboxylate transporter receptor subunit TctC
MKKRSLRFLVIILGIGIFVLVSAYYSLAAEYPIKPITLINPYAPGGSSDLICRLMAKHLGPILKQAVVVENRVGGGGAVGWSYVAKAPTDGYTLVTLQTPMIFHTFILPELVYTPESFAPIAYWGFEPNIMVIKTGSRLDMPTEKLFTYLKQHPNEIVAGTGGRWGILHLAVELLESATGAKLRKVHFTGAQPAGTSLLGGHIDTILTFYPDAMPLINSGEFKVVAVASEKRFQFLPNTPTFRELGIDVVIGIWRGLAAPARTPEAILEVLEKASKEAMMKPEMIEDFKKINVELTFKDRKAFSQLIAADVKKYKLVFDQLKKSKE